MNTTPHRGLLTFLALIGAIVGFRAYFAPHNWYENFCGGGLSWLPQLGPYNEHFIYHITMLRMYSPRDQMLNVIVLSAILIASAAIFTPVRRPERTSQRV
jgi:hypothetical protein